MNLLRRHHGTTGVATLLVSALGLAGLALSACNEAQVTTGPIPNVLPFVGTITGDSGSLRGSITLDVIGTAVTGTFRVVAPDDAVGTHVVNGTYGSDKKLSVTGYGYTFNGVYNGVDRLDGTLAGPKISTTDPDPTITGEPGEHKVAGPFVTAQAASGAAFCGTFTGTNNGVFDFTIAGTTVSGTSTSTLSPPTATTLDGTVSGNSITITNPANPSGPPFAVGTRAVNDVSGTYDDGAGNSGTWTGSLCNSNVLIFVGTASGDNASLSGSVTLYVDATGVTGSLKTVAPAVATQQLTGTYSSGTKEVTVSGGGYVFDGAYDGTAQLTGTMSGSATGTFIAASHPWAVAFCGTFTGTDNGTFNFTIDGAALHGSAVSTVNTVTPLDGTYKASTGAITITNPAANPPPGFENLATGTRSGNSVSGAFDDGAGSNGTWTGSRCN